ncbi:MAG: HAMP domain-containing histidine kinase [Oscillospiraceae bacterium]|nr:HAMP domain-containing histidine kinase [Oscillospiraceae bacterium]
MKNFFSSIRFRAWLIFMGFALGLLGFLYVNQVMGLPLFYNMIKTNESMQTVKFLKTHWDSDDFDLLVSALAGEQEMRITVFRPNPHTGVLRVSAFDPNNSFHLVSRDDRIADDLREQLLNAPNGIFTEKHTWYRRSMLYTAALIGTANDVKGYVSIYNFLEPLANTTDVLNHQFFVNFFIVLFFAFILSLFMALKVSNPIIKISKTAGKLTTGDFNYDIKQSDYTEIKSLADNLNKASSEIAKTDNLRKDLIANVSHDLKTPLTMIKAYAEMIRDLSGDNPLKREQHLEVIIDEVDRLNNLVVDMLDLSKLQSGVAAPKITEYDFSESLHKVIRRFDYFKDEDCAIETQIEDNVVIKADARAIEQVVYNLLNNAINYSVNEETGNKTTVTIRLYRLENSEKYRFEVIDTGKGIKREELSRIWERYYKGEPSKNHKRTMVGTGLGLSIVKGILESHGFAYGVDSALGRGCVFWFEV